MQKKAKPPEATDLYRILIVDPDSLFREMLSAAITLHNPACTVLNASSPSQALELLNDDLVDLIITEIDFEEPDGVRMGVDFLEQATLRQAPGEVLVVTTRPHAECASLVDASQFMAKPPVMDELLRRIDSVLDSHRDSILRGLSLPSVLQVIQHDNKTCTVTVSADARLGFLYCVKGRLVHAVASFGSSKAEGRDAALEVLNWADATIRLTERCRSPETIKEPLTNILLDWALQADQSAKVPG
jgi:DNA-binding response OmpR family regulator